MQILNLKILLPDSETITITAGTIPLFHRTSHNNISLFAYKVDNIHFPVLCREFV